jgi:hypothetical protein
VHGQIGENLAVHLDPGLRQTVDEARIGQFGIMRADGGVDPLDPQRAERFLALDLVFSFDISLSIPAGKSGRSGPVFPAFSAARHVDEAGEAGE